MIFLFLALLQLPVAHADEATCLQTGQSCSDVDIDRPLAKASYEKGCQSKEAYSCSRLGQYFETKESDFEKAMKFYDEGCRGKDKFGCEQASELHQRYCYIEGKKEFCDTHEPKGEYRIFAYLKTFNPKYANAFADHNFEDPWEMKEVGDLFQKRLKERNQQLLKTLEKEMNSTRHDGADAEYIQDDILTLKGKCAERDDDGFCVEKKKRRLGPYKGAALH
jgi:TPR repeat protein